ncbi:MAG: uncharacterized protein KVP18_003807 [Porospora cf. gigantea A]|uniref:uncharacterized protein n=1 Tax=Porospora cf. gigantea A TaxID=2853593 RepID=UPI00355AC75A|nr:MAG: hypothetical protein KVP18_003807 [Porospora cf. gigantea A]
MVFRIQTTSARSSHVGVQEFSAEEGMCFLPYWLMQHLGISVGEIVNILNVTLPKGSYVRIQLPGIEFLDLSNPKVVLETALRSFATVTVGDVIPITYNDVVYEVEIIELKPSNAVGVIETDMEVEFYVPPELLRSPEPVVSEVADNGEPSAEPWLNALSRGVRTTSTAFNLMIREGRVAGVVGSHDNHGKVFQGKGRLLE